MFVKLYKTQLIVYLVMSIIVGGMIAIDNGVVRGAVFAVACFIFLTLYSFLSHKKQMSKYGKKDI